MSTKFRNPDLSLLLIRLALAYEFISSSWQKLNNIPASLILFTHLGLPFSHFALYLVCGVEMLGGICMLLGAFTEVAGLVLAVGMLGVIITVRAGALSHTVLAGHDFEFMLLIMSLSIALTGPGRFALMRPKQKQILV